MTQRYALDSAKEKYLVADHHKFDKKDFYGFYPIHKVDYVITDTGITKDKRKEFNKYVSILTK